MRIWFNQTFSSIHAVLRNIRRADADRRITLLFSHVNPHAPGMVLADESFVEPSNLEDESYLEWALAFCRDNRVNWFWPGKAVVLMAENRSRFLAVGTDLMTVAEPETLKLLNDKSAFYAALTPEVALPPDAVTVGTLAEFDRAYALLRGKYPRICVKPAVSVFGLGFRVVDEERGSITHLLRGVEYQIPLSELRLGMHNMARFDPLLVMEYLPGPEWSVDCVAKQGDLWVAVQRKKPQQAGYGQTIDDHPAIAEMVERLTARFRLNGLFNIQFKQGIEGPRLLEINARPSGGVGMACQSGINLAGMAIQTLSQSKPLPNTDERPVYGRLIAEINTPVTLSAA